MDAKQESMRDLVQLFEFIPEIHFWIKDRKGRFLAANEAFIRHFGMKSFREMEGKTDFEVHPFPFAREYSLDDQLVASRKKVLANKLELVREKDGALYWYTTTKVPLRDAKWEIWATAGCTRKVTSFGEDKSEIRSLGQVVDVIQQRYAENLTIKDMAGMVGLSVAQFERNFRKFMQDTPLKYLNKTRLRAACQLLLRTELSVAEVAHKAGFSDASYFTKRFFNYLRIKPSDYRLKYGPGTASR